MMYASKENNLKYNNPLFGLDSENKRVLLVVIDSLYLDIIWLTALALRT